MTVQLAYGAASVTIECSTEMHATADGVEVPIPAGQWRFVRTAMQRPVQRFHVFAKSFRPDEREAMNTYIREWSARRYSPQSVLRGDVYTTVDGRTLDGREYWISLARASTESEAKTIIRQLEALSTWAWPAAETLSAGAGTVSARAASGQQLGSLPIPLRLTGDTPITVTSGAKSGSYSGAIELRVEPDGSLGVYETLPMEEYLAGVLPSEMPALWPVEALKAQAITARSDILSHLGYKHLLEGYHFTNGQGDRVYAGLRNRHPASDAAVQATRGQVLVQNGRIVAAVFSSNCGGWTEDNDVVWSGPPNPSLRAVSDLKSGGLSPGDPARWVTGRPPAYCSGDEKGFRWVRHVTAAELSRSVNKYHPIGPVLRIEPGDRGPGGRLKSITVRGANSTATIRKELPIRQALGDLPSAVLIIKEERGPAGPISWTFLGAGRGHGVGLCQHGARGMALDGHSCEAIVRHYFSGAALAVVR